MSARALTLGPSAVVALDSTLRCMAAFLVADRERIRPYRARMRGQGLRPVEVWVPDVRSPAFAAEAHCQSALVAAADRASGDMDFVEAVSDDWGK